ncbi:DUF2809 domain-containing protein [Actinoplanes oblitus]|uniref:DUF2809 domain-containing protein n=1 Tax=Actinoplanes oblitus TaxID=3040509 RepID=A0ABY8WDD4_9ACTN|nr:DUF2809 domain-containing protein [Actinoplanes oblitus]WIM95131.1 DUF2809 domain-containing protein [Actinoplanes oblitus]
MSTWVGPRLLAGGAAVGCVLLAFGIRAFTGSPLLSNGLVEQASGTALYAAAVFAGVVFLWPRLPVGRVALIAAGWCWAVELLQLSPIPAELSARSVVARLVLGVSFDPADLFWYLAGVLPAALVLAWARRRGRARPAIMGEPRSRVDDGRHG